MDMEIALSFVVLAVVDCPISAHSLINKIPLHIIPHDFLRKFITPFKHCLALLKPPYVCNGCTERHGCKLQRHLYDAKYAQKEYEAVRSESRQGFAISEEELKRIDAIIAPLVKQGQSIHHICIENADNIMLDEKTIYNYIDAGLLSVGNIDLPRKVRYRIRKKKKPVRVDKQCHIGRTYDDFQEFIAANPDVAIVEMDSVEGRKVQLRNVNR